MKSWSCIQKIVRDWQQDLGMVVSKIKIKRSREGRYREENKRTVIGEIEEHAFREELG